MKQITFNYVPLTAYIGGSLFQLGIVLSAVFGIWLLGYHAGQMHPDPKHWCLYGDSTSTNTSLLNMRNTSILISN